MSTSSSSSNVDTVKGVGVCLELFVGDIGEIVFVVGVRDWKFFSSFFFLPRGDKG